MPELKHHPTTIFPQNPENIYGQHVRNKDGTVGRCAALGARALEFDPLWHHMFVDNTCFDFFPFIYRSV